jgi:hypothetical protein
MKQTLGESEMRVLAVLKINDGSIEDPKGRAIYRLWRLSTINTQATCKYAVDRLVKRGLVLKDVRYNELTLQRYPGDETKKGLHARCYVVCMVDNEYTVDQWAIEELWEQIRERKENPIIRSPRKKDRELDPQHIVAETSQPEPELTTEEKLAEAIVKRVIHHAQHPTVVYVNQPDPQLQVNIDKLQQAVEKLAQENEGLKKQLAEEKGKQRRQRKDQPITTAIRDLVPEEEWAKIMRQPPRYNKE